jgi:hypothetical protein
MQVPIIATAQQVPVVAEKPKEEATVADVASMSKQEMIKMLLNELAKPDVEA